MGEHDKALEILVRDIQDFNGAEKYCDQISRNKSNSFKQKMLTNLVKAFLNSNCTVG